MLASIDVGSNTVRLLLGSVDTGKVVPHLYVRRITRLKGGQTNQCLAPEAISRTLSALNELSAVIAQHQPASVRVVGTEALRSAANANEFCSLLLEQTGLELDIVDGQEEAFLTATGALSAISEPSDTVLVFDVGGGSTEFVLVHCGEIFFQKSYKLGVVDLSEKLPLRENRLSKIQASIDLLSSEVGPIFEKFDIKAAAVTLVGTAGTAITLAAIDMQMVDYDWRRVNGYSLDIESIESIYTSLSELSVDERELLPGMEKGRGDLILAGIEITREIMQRFNTDNLTISDFGLLEGVMLKMP